MTPYIAFFVSAIFFAVCNLAVRAGDIVRELKRFNDREEEWERELKLTQKTIVRDMNGATER